MEEKKKEEGVTVELELDDDDDGNPCLGVSGPVGMLLPYRLCCRLGIENPFLTGFTARMPKCIFDFSKCQEYKPLSDLVCCQTFEIELGSRYATGINCVPLEDGWGSFNYGD